MQIECINSNKTKSTFRTLQTAQPDLLLFGLLLQTIQMKLILLCVWVEPAVLGSTKTALKFKYEMKHIDNSMYGAGYKLKK